jgi:hypothetical protein
VASKYPSLVRRLGLSEYLLPGFGYEAASAPAPYWDTYQNWQLAFFSIPDIAEFFIRGRERQMLEWYFFHSSYSGVAAVPDDVLSLYTNSIAKPGFLRAMFGPFSTKAVRADHEYFRETVGRTPLAMPVLALGGEASFGMGIKPLFANVSSDLTADAVPKAGHWIGEFFPSHGTCVLLVVCTLFIALAVS